MLKAKSVIRIRSATRMHSRRTFLCTAIVRRTQLAVLVRVALLVPLPERTIVWSIPRGCTLADAMGILRT